MLAEQMPRWSGEYVTVVPPCPSCGRPMYLARSIPLSDTRAGSSVFKCGECGVWLTQSAEEGRVA